MAAVSITLQIVETIDNIKEFWKGMKDAPWEVEHIICELDLLAGILSGLRRAVQLRSPGGPDPVQISSVLAALQQCQRHVCRMSEFANDLQDGFQRRRRVTSFKAALKKPKMTEFSRKLEQAKATLLLAINVASFMIEERCSERVLQQFSDLRSDIEMKFVLQSELSTPKLVPESQTSHSNFQHSRKKHLKHGKTISTKGYQICGSDVLLWLLQLPLNSP
ncbi:hypothetical protein BDZ45DRAFT_190047 [Acephala macrosclerotiorum]|nr:hypothetical protein BDZ45DRAFT_190047 [Acephala macrosclerotiorum]